MTPIDTTFEQVLVLKSQMGDRSALEELYRRYNPRLGYYLRRMLPPADAADVQQEVWLAVLRKLPRLRAAQAFAVWLYRIARNKALNRSADRRSYDPLDEATEVAADTPDPSFTAADAALVHQSLDKLPPAQREALMLRFMEGLSYEQIAEVAGCGIGTVRSRLHYAKLHLAQELEKNNEHA